MPYETACESHKRPNRTAYTIHNISLYVDLPINPYRFQVESIGINRDPYWSAIQKAESRSESPRREGEREREREPAESSAGDARYTGAGPSGPRLGAGGPRRSSVGPCRALSVPIDFDGFQLCLSRDQQGSTVIYIYIYICLCIYIHTYMNTRAANDKACFANGQKPIPSGLWPAVLLLSSASSPLPFLLLLCQPLRVRPADTPPMGPSGLPKGGPRCRLLPGGRRN